MDRTQSTEYNLKVSLLSSYWEKLERRKKGPTSSLSYVGKTSHQSRGSVFQTEKKDLLFKRQETDVKKD